MNKITICALVFLCFGCVSNKSSFLVVSPLVDELKKLGVSPETVTYMKIRGDEAFDVKIDLTLLEPKTLRVIWNSIGSSTAYELWNADGYRNLDFYSDEKSTPVVSLKVNSSGATHIDKQKNRYRCLGLHRFLERVIKIAKENKKLYGGNDEGLFP